jgi:hypothetical protein
LFENIDKFGETKNGFQIKEEVYDPLQYNDYSESKFNNWEEQQKQPPLFLLFGQLTCSFIK